jgi:hypothetical protein
VGKGIFSTFPFAGTSLNTRLYRVNNKKPRMDEEEEK